MENTMTSQHGRDLTVGSIPRQLVAFALPIHRLHNITGIWIAIAFSCIVAKRASIAYYGSGR